MERLDFGDIDEIVLKNVRIDLEELVIELEAPSRRIVKKIPLPKPEIPVYEYPGKIAEVTIGGGSRKKIIKIGGQSSLYWFEEGIKNRAVITYDVFDCPQPQFPKALKQAWSEVWDSPEEWAKKAIERGADLITIHLVSTDPRIMDTSPREAAKTVEDILQAVDVPLVVGGCGNPKKDPETLAKVAEIAEGEKCVLASANLDLDYKKIAKAAIEHEHNVLSWVSLDINDQKHLNRLLFKEGLSKEQIIQDPTTAALGYGIEYTFTIIERIKQNALKGDEELQMPISCGVTNAWGARESWRNLEEWGPREYRGPLWETITGITVLLAGADLLMMLHPMATQKVKEIIKAIGREIKGREIEYERWLEV